MEMVDGAHNNKQASAIGIHLDRWNHFTDQKGRFRIGWLIPVKELAIEKPGIGKCWAFVLDRYDPIRTHYVRGNRMDSETGSVRKTPDGVRLSYG